MRFSRFLSSSKSVLGRAANIKDSYWLKTQHGFSTSGPDLVTDAGSTSIGRFANYTVFKGKAALSMKPILPAIRELDQSRSSRVYRNGSVILTFWPAVGQRKYDWEKKQVFALSATEVGSLIGLGPTESCEFLHDPSMKSSLEGQVKKSLSISPLGNDNGYFINLSVVNNIQKTNERLSVPISKAEFTVIRTVLSYVLPHIMGWPQAMMRAQQPTTETKTSKSRPDPIFEWGR
ncbi:single-stranded DNA-binding protein WHY2, mitochondrial-like isoform X1 [Musa acuminata AAA Group]|uniref:single-stranded DNA-binding protein WHY2, mitochondrial-like isoform X1 n=1 Tax=Musa acuminata AAA Group TaxID=214697 RepID=UPI0031D89D7D